MVQIPGTDEDVGVCGDANSAKLTFIGDFHFRETLAGLVQGDGLN